MLCKDEAGIGMLSFDLAIGGVLPLVARRVRVGVVEVIAVPHVVVFTASSRFCDSPNDVLALFFVEV